jgi:hypothetical protein
MLLRYSHSLKPASSIPILEPGKLESELFEAAQEEAEKMVSAV